MNVVFVENNKILSIAMGHEKIIERAFYVHLFIQTLQKSWMI
jgi:hypothetical protein